MSKPRTKFAGRGNHSAGPGSDGASTLVNRNVHIRSRRTSLRLEPAMWDALDEICAREGVTEHELCTQIDGLDIASSLTASVRVFIVTYFRGAATEKGHAGARRRRWPRGPDWSRRSRRRAGTGGAGPGPGCRR
ncbi:MAG: ribbon-helix-helix domain-containing protein [Proteobacteria bacterium]|nr:ribbon-helix-helix domain-containing protein [Pseudomonadota bacterium]